MALAKMSGFAKASSTIFVEKIRGKQGQEEERWEEAPLTYL